MLEKLYTIEYKKLIFTILTHLFVAVLYGISFSIIAQEYGVSKYISKGIELFTITLVVYLAYKEKLKRYYPFSKVIGINLLGFILWFFVALTKIYFLNIFAFFIVLFAIKYKCKKCVTYKRFSLG